MQKAKINSRGISTVGSLDNGKLIIKGVVSYCVGLFAKWTLIKLDNLDCCDCASKDVQIEIIRRGEQSCSKAAIGHSIYSHSSDRYCVRSYVIVIIRFIGKKFVFSSTWIDIVNWSEITCSNGTYRPTWAWIVAVGSLPGQYFVREVCTRTQSVRFWLQWNIAVAIIIILNLHCRHDAVSDIYVCGRNCALGRIWGEANFEFNRVRAYLLRLPFWINW